jgi:alpha-beta hydrolase superfamily lysophospholipase
VKRERRYAALVAAVSSAPASLASRVVRFVVVAALLYVALVGIAALTYRSFVFPAPGRGVTPVAPGAVLIERDVSGLPLVALFAPPAPGRRLVAYFHGNGEELGDLSRLATTLTGRGAGILFVEYPGYGLAKAGTATEANLYAVADAALLDLQTRGIGRERIVLVGFSLGTGVAAEMALRGRGDRLLLIAPYTSMDDMVQLFLPVVPSSFFVRDHFDTLSKAPRLALPTVVVHGDADSLIPVVMGRRVSGAIAGAKLEVFAGGEHHDLFTREDGRLVDLIVDQTLDR